MNKILVTGASGFVGHHFIEYISRLDDDIQIIGTDYCNPSYDVCKYVKRIGFTFVNVNLSNYDEIRSLLSKEKPDFIVHLASMSSVGKSWLEPIQTFQNNTGIFLNLVTAIWDLELCTRVLSIGSSEEYGNSISKVPFLETDPLNPNSPYGIARVSQEMLSILFAKKYDLDIVLTRSFNHLGPGQDTRFAIPSFVKSVLEKKKEGDKRITLTTGDISVVRDFVDVRDVVEAYYMLLKSGKRGEIYNICSGKGIELSEVVSIIAELCNIHIETIIDPRLLRPDENKWIVGNPTKTERLGWMRKYSIENSLNDMIEEMA